MTLDVFSVPFPLLVACDGYVRSPTYIIEIEIISNLHMSGTNPPLSEDDDSSLLNYYGSRDSSMVLQESAGAMARLLNLNLEVESKNISSTKLTTMNERALDTLSKLLHEPNTDAVINRIMAPYTSANQEKVLVRFLAVGLTRQVEPRVFKISQTQPFSLLILFLHRKFGVGSLGRVFCYLHNTFSPNPDDNIGSLYRIFGTGQELVVSYCENVAFG